MSEQFPPGFDRIGPSWREVLVNAQAGIGRAYEHRLATIQAAYDAGFSCRQIADVIGISAAGVHRIIGKQSAGRDVDALLDSPAYGRLGSDER